MPNADYTQKLAPALGMELTEQDMINTVVDDGVESEIRGYRPKQVERIKQGKIVDSDLFWIRAVAQDYADDMWNGLMEAREHPRDEVDAHRYMYNYIIAKILITRLDERMTGRRS